MPDAKNASLTSVTTVTFLAGAAGVTAAGLIAVATLFAAPRTAQALPQYAQQTGLPCGQCHVSPGGGGKLKPFGQRFKAKGHKL